MKTRVRPLRLHLLFALTAISATALAGPGWDHGPPGPGPGWGHPPGHWDGPGRWGPPPGRPGYWHHGWHDGRLGWWWVLGGAWVLYPAPVYPYPSSSTVVIEDAPASPFESSDADSGPPPSGGGRYWYHCNSPEGYYPYVSSCPGGWRAVEATPPGEVTR